MKNVLDNEKLIYFVINRYFKNVVKFDTKNTEEDYFQVGMIGLVKADKKYNSSAGKFSTFACSCIYNEICSFIKKEQRSNKEFTNCNISSNKLYYNDKLFEEFCSNILSCLNNKERKYIEQIIHGFSKKEALEQLNITNKKEFIKKIKDKLYEKNIIVQ